MDLIQNIVVQCIIHVLGSTNTLHQLKFVCLSKEICKMSVGLLKTPNSSALAKKSANLEKTGLSRSVKEVLGRTNKHGMYHQQGPLWIRVPLTCESGCILKTIVNIIFIITITMNKTNIYDDCCSWW